MNIKDIINTCEICQDLIPLVIDNVASEDSFNFVKGHVQNCGDCREIYNGIQKPSLNNTSDDKIILSIKKKLYFSSIVMLIIGGILGVYLSYSLGMFYNFIIMPLIGALGYYIFDKKFYIVPVSIFMITYIWLFIGFMISYNKISIELFAYPIYLALIYTTLSLVGIFIGSLFKFAFGKEEKENVKKT